VKAFERYRTQAEIEVAIQHHIRLGGKAEARRDVLPFESEAYWRAHDVARKHFSRAEALMPQPRRSR
jgi:hypothetical protein